MDSLTADVSHAEPIAPLNERRRGIGWDDEIGVESADPIRHREHVTVEHHAAPSRGHRCCIPSEWRASGSRRHVLGLVKSTPRSRGLDRSSIAPAFSRCAADAAAECSDAGCPLPRRPAQTWGSWRRARTSAAQLERLQEHLQRRRLFKVRERLEALLQDAPAKETPYADFLDLVLTEEVASKTAKHVTMRTRLARFPFVKSLETFDFSSLR